MPRLCGYGEGRGPLDGGGALAQIVDQRAVGVRRVAAARAEASARMDVVLGMEDVVAAYRRFGARLISDGVEARLVESCLMSLRRAPSDRLDAAGDDGGVEAR